MVRKSSAAFSEKDHIPQVYEDSSDDLATAADEQLVPEFEMVTEPGFFPVFDRDGYCGDSDFNPWKVNYSVKLKKYAIQLETEIPLKMLAGPQKLFLDFLPTHCFTKTAAFLIPSPKGGFSVISL